MPIDTLTLTKSSSSACTRSVGVTCGLVRAIDSPRSGLGECAFGSPATCVSVSMAALPALSAPSSDAPDNVCVSPRSYTPSDSDGIFSPGDFSVISALIDTSFSPRSSDSDISYEYCPRDPCVRHLQASSNQETQSSVVCGTAVGVTPTAGALPPELLACQPCDFTFSILTIKELSRASMTCCKSFVSLRPALKLREHLFLANPSLNKTAVSQFDAHSASKCYLADALGDRFSSLDLLAPCSFSFLPLCTLLSLASVSISLFAVAHPAVRFRRAQRKVELVWLYNNVAVRRFSKGAVYYCTLCQATFLSRALYSVCECMICGECNCVKSQFTQFFNTSVSCDCVELLNTCIKGANDFSTA